jgi:hypothetical protein
MSLVNSWPCFTWITLVNITIIFSCAGCASVGPQSETEALNYNSRATTRSDGAVLVYASVLSAEESLDIYGVSIASKEIQPVWIEVENGEDDTY